MSQKQFPNKRQKKRSISVPHSQKSAAAKNSYESRQDAVQLTNKMHDLARIADLAQNRAEIHWQKAKKYQAEGRMELALEQKVYYQKGWQRYKFFIKELQKIEMRIDKLLLGYSVRPQKKQNYVKIKVQKPPRDNAD